MGVIWTPGGRDETEPIASLGPLFKGRDFRTFVPTVGGAISVGRGRVGGTLSAGSSIVPTQYGQAVRGGFLFADSATGLSLDAGSCDLTGLTEVTVIAICRLGESPSSEDNGIFRIDQNGSSGNAQLGFSFVVDSSSQITWRTLISSNSTTGWTAATFVTDARPPANQLLVMMTRWKSLSPIENMWAIAGGGMRSWAAAGHTPSGTVAVTAGSASNLHPHIGGMAESSGTAFPGDIYSIMVLPHRINEKEAARVVESPFDALFGEPQNDPVFYSLGGGGVTVDGNVGAALGAGLAANVASPITVAGAVGAALASDYAAGVSSPITIAASPGASVASDYAANVASAITVAGSVGAAVGDGLSATVSTGVTIAASVGAASASGLPAGIASPITVAASVGAAVASGLSAGISTGNSVAASTGAAVAAGLTAGVSSPITVAASVGAASAAGLQATVSAGTTIQTGTGAAIALGLTGNVAGQIIIPAALGRALGVGLQASVTVGDEIAASVGAATAAGLAATIANPTVALTAATGTRGGYGVQMQLSARRAQIQTGRRRN